MWNLRGPDVSKMCDSIQCIMTIDELVLLIDEKLRILLFVLYTFTFLILFNTYFTSVVPTALLLYCYNVTGRSQESEGSYKPARIKEVHSKLHSFQASLYTLTATHLTLIYVCTYIRLSVPLGRLIKQAGIIIHTILNLWETLEIEPVTSGLKIVPISN